MKPCSTEGCPRPVHSRGMCSRCYSAAYRRCELFRPKGALPVVAPRGAAAPPPAPALQISKSANAPSVPRWRGSCGARCRDTGKVCALPAHPGPWHAVGRHRFHLTAAPGVTHFPRAAELAVAAQVRDGVAGGEA